MRANRPGEGFRDSRRSAEVSGSDTLAGWRACGGVERCGDDDGAVAAGVAGGLSLGKSEVLPRWLRRVFALTGRPTAAVDGDVKCAFMG